MIEARCAGDVRHHAVEHEASLLVAVEAEVEERAQESAALRGAERERALRLTSASGACLIHAAGSRHGREAQARDRRFAASYMNS